MKYMSEYDLQAHNFLIKADTTMEMTFIDVVIGFPFDDHDKQNHNHYSIKLRRNGKTYTFNFYDSYHNYCVDEKPTKYDVLATLQTWEVESDVWDFAKEYGYNITSKEDYNKIKKIHRECATQYTKLLKLFGADLMEELNEIR